MRAAVAIVILSLSAYAVVLVPALLDVEWAWFQPGGAPVACFARGHLRVSLTDCGHPRSATWHGCFLIRGSRYNYWPEAWLPFIATKERSRAWRVPAGPHRILVVPLPSLAILSNLALLLPYLALRRIVSKRRRAMLCQACGYDIRGLNLTQCPECGTAPSPRGPKLSDIVP